MKQDHHEYEGNYKRQAVYYDAIYEAQGKDYKKESEQLHDAIERYKTSSGSKLLDVGCGTGGHLAFLRAWYSVEGLDLDQNMLSVAKQRFPDVTFHQGDMVDFLLEGQFDAVTCLFSAIGYTKTSDKMRKAVKAMGRHLTEGGVLVVEPWITPDKWRVGIAHATYVDKPGLKIARINISEREGDRSIFNFHFLVASEGRVEYFTELHELGLFTEQEYLDAFKDAGLDVILDHQGITGRGLFIGVKQPGHE
jgi:ubiquinone/menaquinone biosynthesis C-methylase UbiE